MSLPTNRMPGDIIEAVDINQIAEAVNDLTPQVPGGGYININGAVTLEASGNTPYDGGPLVFDAAADMWVAAPPGSGTSGPGGTTDHAALTNRDAADQHPIGAITGLQTALNGKAATGHGHTIEDVEYLQMALNSKAEGGHQHGADDLSGVVKTVNGTGPDALGNVTVAGGGSAPRYGVARVHPTSLYSTYMASTLVPVGATIAASTNTSAVGMVSVAPVTVTEVGVNVTTAGTAGAVVRFGIYADNAGKPGSLLWDSGDVPAETIGTTFVSVNGGLLLSGDLWTIAVYSGGVGMMGWDPTANERAAGTSGGSARVLTTNATTGAPLPATLTISGNNSSNGRAAALLVKA